MASLAACLAGNEEAFLPFLLVVLGFELRALRLLGRGTLVLPPVTLGSFYVCGCLRVLAGIGVGRGAHPADLQPQQTWLLGYPWLHCTWGTELLSTALAPEAKAAPFLRVPLAPSP
jgi:hypothetical protein